MIGDGVQSESFDLIIIGAGLYGIQVARTYLELHPTHNVVLLEASSTLGGVWSVGKSTRPFDSGSKVLTILN